MNPGELPEVWLRGPVQGIPDLLQPVAHALMQANEEISKYLAAFPKDKLWTKPGEIASVAFHLQHIAGVLDRLFTYAAGQQLSNAQLKYLSEEGLEDDTLTVQMLLDHLGRQIHNSIEKLKEMHSSELTSPREVGRKKFPSTVMGLLFHSAEHTMRHTGQLLVTARIVTGNLK